MQAPWSYDVYRGLRALGIGELQRAEWGAAAAGVGRLPRRLGRSVPGRRLEAGLHAFSCWLGLLPCPARPAGGAFTWSLEDSSLWPSRRGQPAYSIENTLAGMT